jgi:MFS transporter, PAT family, beta-lactamase induction signal transducer AmpG
MARSGAMSRKLAILSTLYFVQGLPYGFQLIALPVYLRGAGVSLTGIGLASALSLPWVFKVVWGPAVDRWGSPRFGRRRSWIVPLQLSLLTSCVIAAYVPPDRGLWTLLAMVFLMNLFASTMDVAVDGMAVDLLRVEELGYGNVAQVVGYKLGILTGGGLLVWASGRIGWHGLFLAMSALIAAAVAVTFAFREPPPKEDRTHESLGAIVAALWQALRVPGTGFLLLFIGTYKLGETMADAMFKPFLFDEAHFTAQQVGFWLGTWGMVLSLTGSFLGGVLASRIGILHAVAIASGLRALAVAGEWWLSLVEPTTSRVAAVIAVESLFGGAVTTAIFAYMMSRVDRRIAATHYTLLATVEVFGKQLASWISGFVADLTGYPTLFLIATVLAVAFLGLLIPVYRMEAGTRP